MPAIDIHLMKAQADLEHELEAARASLAETRIELATFNRTKAEQDLAWPEGPPVPWRTLNARASRLERRVEALELALTGADQLVEAGA
ncbi:MAG: hypothetical protein VW516_09565 [Rhodospirillaceae bacterium]|jgi:hypothetical protein